MRYGRSTVVVVFKEIDQQSEAYYENAYLAEALARFSDEHPRLGPNNIVSIFRTEKGCRVEYFDFADKVRKFYRDRVFPEDYQEVFEKSLGNNVPQYGGLSIPCPACHQDLGATLRGIIDLRKINIFFEVGEIDCQCPHCGCFIGAWLKTRLNSVVRLYQYTYPDYGGEAWEAFIRFHQSASEDLLSLAQRNSRWFEVLRLRYGFWQEPLTFEKLGARLKVSGAVVQEQVARFVQVFHELGTVFAESWDLLGKRRTRILKQEISSLTRQVEVFQREVARLERMAGIFSMEGKRRFSTKEERVSENLVRAGGLTLEDITLSQDTTDRLRRFYCRQGSGISIRQIVLDDALGNLRLARNFGFKRYTELQKALEAHGIYLLGWVHETVR